MNARRSSVRAAVRSTPLAMPACLPALVLLFTLAVASQLPAREWIVPTDAPTVAAGIDSAQVGDTVTLLADTYYESSLVMKSGITLKGSTADPDDVILDGDGSSIMSGTALAPSTIIQDITFANGGQGLRLDGCSVQVLNCVFSGCYGGEVEGGAVEMWNGGASHFSDCRFLGNGTDSAAGAVFCGGTSAPAFDDCDFVGNSATYGGAVRVADTCVPVFTGCTFSENTAGSYAGAVLIEASYPPYALFDSCVFHLNLANSYGGAVLANGGDATFDNCTFYDNTATAGSALRITNSSSLAVENCIIFGNGGGVPVSCVTSGDITLSCSDVYGNAGGDYADCIASENGSNGNFSEDPMLCGAGSADFTLRECSPCVDAPGCGLVGALGVGCSGRTWLVPGDAPTIAAAIDSAARCDTILLAWGTFQEHDLVMKSGVTIRGTMEAGYYRSTIDAQGLGRVFFCSGLDSTTVIQDLRMVNGDATGEAEALGGIMFVEESDLRVIGCEFYNGTADGGGALRVEYSYTPRFEDCSFTSNTAFDQAGAVYNTTSNTTFLRCTFTENSADSFGSDGGAVYCSGGTSSTPVFRECIFDGNDAGGSGGALQSTSTSTHVTLEDCVLSDNSADDSGGAVQVDGYVSLDGCTISDNWSPTASGIQIAGTGSVLYAGNCVIANGMGGMAVDCYNGGSVMSFTCNDVFNNEGGDYIDCIAGENGNNGNFSADPVFCDPASDDYHLHVSSPCVDASGCGRVGALGAGCGNVWDVPSEVATIAAALDSAAYGDTILVACGTYYESQLYMKPGVVLTSATGEFDCATIDARGDSTMLFDCTDGDTNTVIVGFTLRGTPYEGDLLYAHRGGGFRVRNCRFVNDSSASGGSTVNAWSCDIGFEDCVFDSCAGSEGAVAFIAGGTSAFRGCSFYRSVSAQSGAVLFAREDSYYGTGAQITMVDCSISESASLGGYGDPECAIYVRGDAKGRGAVNVDLSNCIIAFTAQGSAAYCDAGGVVTLTCCDVYGNEGGDYVDCLAGQNGVNDNFSTDPLFCGDDDPAQPLSLQANSPCTAASQPVCGQVGTYGVGCDAFVDWDAGGDGHTWEDQYNWNPDQVPGAGDHARIALAGSYTVTLNSVRTVADLTLGPVAGDVVLDMQSGSLIVTQALENWETIIVRDGAALDAPTAYRTSSITNEPGATFRLDDGDLTGSGTFTNRGYFQKTSSGLSSVELAFLNTSGGRGEDGLMDALAGTLSISGEFENLGRLNIITGQSTMISKHYIGAESRAGSGVFLNDGIVTVASGGKLIALSGTAVVSGGTLQTTGLTDLQGTASFSNTGLVTVKPGGDLAIAGTFDNEAAGHYVNRGRTSISSGAVLTNDGRFDHEENAVLRGSGTFDTSLGIASMRGVIEPGASPGIFSFIGDFIQTSASEIRVEIGGDEPGTEHDQLSIAGAATFAGSVQLSFLPGFTPAPGDSFPVIVQTTPLRSERDSRDTDFDCFSGLDVDTLYMQPLQRAQAFLFRAMTGSSGDAAPVAADDAAEVTGCAPVSVRVLDNDSDPDMDPLSVLAVILDGTFGEAYIGEGDSTVTYVAPEGYAGADSFLYVVGDCVSRTDVAMVRITVAAPPRIWDVPEDAPTIQAGIDSAAVGDTVRVACGTYYENWIELKSGVALTSATGDPDCVIIDGSGRSGQVLMGSNVDDTCLLRGITVQNGSAPFFGGGLYLENSSPVIEDCVFTYNDALAGGAAGITYGSAPSFTDCVFSGNTAFGSGAVYCDSSDPVFTRCVFQGNSGTQGGAGAASFVSSTAYLWNCTVTGNNAFDAQLYASDADVFIEGSIVALTTSGAAVFCDDGATASLACTDVYGNDGGDYVGCLAGQETSDGNLWVDPEFCAPDSGDFHLTVGSPCADAGGCGLLGALPVGCAQQPDIEVLPPELSITLMYGESGCDTLVVSNTSDASSLAWLVREEQGGMRLSDGTLLDVSVAPRSGRRNADRSEERSASPPAAAEPAKGERDTRTGTRPARGAGGPDAFGYRWTDSDEPGGPVFAWLDVTGSGTPLSLGDDASAVVALPFDFPFYGAMHASVRVSSNGYLTFGPFGSDYGNDPVPSVGKPNDVIAPLWTDLNPERGGTIHHYYDSGNERFIVQYTDTQDFWGTGTYTFQVILKPDGAVTFQYLDVEGAVNHATVGVENATGTTGLQVVFNSAYLKDELAVAFEDAAPWLAEYPAAGSLEPSSAETLEVCVETGELPGGVYLADLVFESSDPGEPELRIPLSLTVNTLPDISIEPESFALTVMGGTTACDTLWILNAGTLDLSWLVSRENPGRASGAVRGSGGPDTYGYIWMDSDEPGGPVFEWTDVRPLPGRVPVYINDEGGAQFALPFTFPFYGEEKTQVDIHSNGMLTFDTGASAEEVNDPMPTPSGPGGIDDIIAPFWDDLDATPPPAHVYYYQNVAAGEVVVQYQDIPNENYPGIHTFQVVLRSTGEMLFHYLDMGDYTTSATVGIENATGTDGLEIAYNSAYIHDSLTVWIGEVCPWLSASPDSGQTTWQGREPVAVCVDASSLDSGEYSCNLVIASNDPDLGTLVVPVTAMVVDTGIEDDAPRKYALLGNFPNPFNPVTEIRYELPAAALTSLRVYTLTGRLVRELLAEERQGAGRYSVVWDGRDDQGRPAASGVYFYRLEANGQARSSKMVLLK